MRRIFAVLIGPLLSIVLAGSCLSAQTVGAQPDPGVTPIRLWDRSDVRATRVEVDPGAVRSVHTHDDVRFHLFIPLTGKLELTINKDKPMEVNPGQAIYMEKGTPHGFKNVGTTKAAVMEVFVKADSAAATEQHVIELVRAFGAAGNDAAK
jgi:quercetin dioxygenase-like cupin family protein